LKSRKQSLLGELVIATGADDLIIEELAGALLDAAMAERSAREAWRKRGAAFFRGEREGAGSRTGGEQGGAAKDAAPRNRLQAKQARHDTRDWQVKRRERTRHLIELGGLVAKAGLVELTDDERAVILELLVEAAAKLDRPDREQSLALWRRRGLRAFADVGSKFQ
jgi:hypothetical protein